MTRCIDWLIEPRLSVYGVVACIAVGTSLADGEYAEATILAAGSYIVAGLMAGVRRAEKRKAEASK